MSSDWPLISIDEIKADSKSAIAIGPFGSNMKSDCYVNEGVPVIRGTNITGGPTFQGEFVYITQELADKLKSSNVNQYDLVFPHRGSIGEVGIILDDTRYVISSSLMKLTCDRSKVSPKFLYYFFKSSLGRHELLKNASQVGTPGIGQPLASLKSIELKLPPLEIQNKIEAILTSLDEKIELNRQTNQTLEQIAQAIFKSWFVDFEPVKAKVAALSWAGVRGQELAEQAAICAISGKTPEQLAQLDPQTLQQLKATAALFPDALVDSELGEIPEGWAISKVEEVSSKIGMGPFGSNIKVSTFVEAGIPVISGQHLKSTLLTDGDNNFITEEHAEKLKSSNVFPEDIIFTHAGNIGQVSMIPRSSRYKKYIVSQRQFFLRVDRKKTSPYFMTYFFRSPEGQHLLLSNASQVGVPSIARPSSHLKAIELVIPSLEITNAFEFLIFPILETIMKNRELIQTLVSLRDGLLPKLLSGEINLSHL
ncbi:restriction endonuclease subunit S [Methylomonas rosea]|uniref:Restriction endonuclease subunit S n=1 Tax=Methylomonas rosea TaxID=2952227 RepID=A0ABT1TQ27_9GAMM|nr:restriction endonuclease subunit S [Methylomonas sp. WSC-7]MCQ8116874.1 restriction endonuclease subunit S [Methylomonas sp. WSC-7]